MAKSKIDKALDKLADLFKFGNLDIATDPVNFIERVCEEIIRLRKITLEDDLDEDEICEHCKATSRT